MRDIRNVARQRWREAHRRRAVRDTMQRFMSAFIFGAAFATLAAIVIGALHR